MKSASTLLFASVAAAHYGHGIPTTTSKVGYATLYPGHGKGPVTVTKQYQPIPTYVDGKWSQYDYISTVIRDPYGKKVTITCTNQEVTLYHTKTTITHTEGYGYAKPTGYPVGPSNYTAPKTWNELHEVYHCAPFNHLGPHAIPGYPGYPKYHGKKDEQEVLVKEYNHGKWAEYNHVFHYGVPKPAVTTYDTPGIYTLPAQDITVPYPTNVPAEATYHATAGKKCTYGGVYTHVPKPTTITVPYGAYETHGRVTKPVVYTKTITCHKPGKYTIVKPTTTVYDHDTNVPYPTTISYPGGIYHHTRETITVTKPHQPYTCTFSRTSSYHVPAPTNAYPSATKPYGPDPSSDYDEPVQSYGKPSSGFVKRGGVLERRKAAPNARVKAATPKRVIFV